MPSGVSQGSPLPGPAPAVFSNASFVKSGMRLMGLIISQSRSRGSLALVMVGMLIADDAGELIRSVILEGGLARQIGDANGPAEAGLAAELLGRHHPVGAVECAGHDLDLGTFNAPEAEWGAAFGAEVTLGDRRRAECSRLAAGPDKIAMVDLGERRKRRSRCFLTHTAMANTDPGRRHRYREPNGAALAPAGQNGLCRRSHARSASR